jgi:hypothetical protein
METRISISVATHVPLTAVVSFRKPGGLFPFHCWQVEIGNISCFKGIRFAVRSHLYKESWKLPYPWCLSVPQRIAWETVLRYNLRPQLVFRTVIFMERKSLTVVGVDPWVWSAFGYRNLDWLQIKLRQKADKPHEHLTRVFSHKWEIRYSWKRG